MASFSTTIQFIFTIIVVSISTNGYHLSTTPLDWSSANEYCQYQCNSNLASIHTSAEYFIAQEVIANNGITEPVWIGLNNANNPDTFEWSDSSGLTSSNWDDQQPDLSSTTKHCVAINPLNNNKWFNTESSNEYPFLCNSCEGIIKDESSEICKLNNDWKVIQGDTNSLTLDEDECGLSVGSQSHNTIVGLKEKEWKTCDRMKPWIAEMEYRTRNPGANSRTGLVFYPHGKHNNFEDHYFLRIHPIEKIIRLGYIKEGIEVEQIRRSLDIELHDMQWETLRVEILQGYRFKVFLNEKPLFISSHRDNPFDINPAEVMSGFVGVQSILGDIDVKSLYISGMEVYDHYDTEGPREWMEECIFDPINDDDKAPATADSGASETDTDPQSDNGAEPETDNGDGLDLDMETNEDGGDGGDEQLAAMGTTGDDTFVIPSLYIYVPIAAGVLCCMIIVGIYYCRLKHTRDRKRSLEGIFGRQSISMSNSNASSQRQRELEIAQVVREAMSKENQNEMDLNDVELEMEGNNNPAGMGHSNSGHARTSSTVWADNRLYHNDNNPQAHDIRDSVILNTWDVEALEMDCNDIIKNNSKMPKTWRSRAYSE